MRSFWTDPYLWIHLAGLAALPLFLEVCVVGFAIGDPVLPVWLELLLVAAVGTAPILWMQWQKPFYIFSTLVVALKPEQLTDDQRRLLTLFKSQRNRILAAIVAFSLILLLRQLYSASAIAATVVPFAVGWRLVGLIVAAIGFLGSNLFAQVPVSVAGVMLAEEAQFAATPPHPTETIRQSFTLLGLQVNQILPPVLPEPNPDLVVGNAPSEVVMEKPNPKASLTSESLSVDPALRSEADSLDEMNIDPWDVEDSTPASQK